MNSCLIAIIIIIIIIFFYKTKESYIVKPYLTTSTDTKNVEEAYQYPECVGCITYNQKMKPHYKYSITDNRCIKNNTQEYIDKSNLDNIISYAIDPTDTMSSCENNYNSMYSDVMGKYIILFRNDSTKMKFKHILIHQRDTTSNPLTGVIFTTNLEKKGSAYVHPEVALNSSDNNVEVFESGTMINTPSYTVITLSIVANIGYVKIDHSNVADASTLNGANLLILNDIKSSITVGSNNSSLSSELQVLLNSRGYNNMLYYPSNLVPETVPSSAVVVFYTSIITNDINRIIYTYNYLKPLPSYVTKYMPIVNKWQMPCDNCFTVSDKLYAGHYYNMPTPDPRCYRPLTNEFDKNILNTEIPKSVLDTKFDTCNPDFDTRYVPPIGSYIHIYKASEDSNPTITFTNIQFYYDYKYNTYDILNNFPSFSAYVADSLNESTLFANALDNDNTTIFQTTNGSHQRIFINFGSYINMPISAIGFKITTSKINLLNRLIIYLIKIDENDIFNKDKMIITSMRTIQPDDLTNFTIDSNDILNCTVLIPLSNNANDPVSNYSADLLLYSTITYDKNFKMNTTYKKNGIYYQIPGFIYAIGIRSFITKTFIDSTILLDKIGIPDPAAIYNVLVGIDAMPIPGVPDSIFSRNLPMRYIYITPSLGQDLKNVILSIKVFDRYSNLVKSVSNPPAIYTNPEPLYNKYLYDVDTLNLKNGCILVDLGANKPVVLFSIELTDISYMNILANSMIYVIDENIITYHAHLPGPFTGTILYRLTDRMSMRIWGDAPILNKYAYPSCINTDICNNIASNIYYIMDNGQCFLSNPSVDPTCTNCISQLSSFSKTNQLPSILANFRTCLPGIDTRIPLLVDFITWYTTNASSLLKTGNIQANIGDQLIAWLPSINGGTLKINLLSFGTFVTKIVDLKGRPGISVKASSLPIFSDASLNIFNATIFVVFMYNGNYTVTPFMSSFYNDTGMIANAFIIQVLSNGRLSGTIYNTTPLITLDFPSIAPVGNLTIFGLQMYNSSPTQVTVKYILSSYDNNVHTLNTWSNLQLTNTGNSSPLKFGKAYSNLQPGQFNSTQMNLYEIAISKVVMTDDEMLTKYTLLYNKWITNYP